MVLLRLLVNVGREEYLEEGWVITEGSSGESAPWTADLRGESFVDLFVVNQGAVNQSSSTQVKKMGKALKIKRKLGTKLVGTETS